MKMLVLALALGGAAAAQPSARPAILAANKVLQEGIAKGDTAAILGVYASTPEAVPPGAEVARGRDAVAKVWQRVIDEGATRLEIVVNDIDTQGDTADEQGKFTFKLKDGTVYRTGQYHCVWKKEKGLWKLQRSEWKPAG